MREYIHYGTDRFDKNHAKAPRTPRKPSGFWASPIDAEYGWIDFSISGMPENLDFIAEGPYLIFHLKEGTRVLDIRSPEDIEPYLIAPGEIDHEKLEEDYDALELHLSGENWDQLYYDKTFYGWDCDSIVIWNPECIIEDKDKKIERDPEKLLSIIEARESCKRIGRSTAIALRNIELKNILRNILEETYKAAKKLDEIDPDSSDTVLERSGTSAKELKQLDVHISFSDTQRRKGEPKSITINTGYLKRIFEYISEEAENFDTAEHETIKKVDDIAKRIEGPDIKLSVLRNYFEEAYRIVYEHREYFGKHFAEELRRISDSIKKAEDDGFVIGITKPQENAKQMKRGPQNAEEAEKENIRLAKIVGRSLRTAYDCTEKAERMSPGSAKEEIEKIKALSEKAKKLGIDTSFMKKRKNIRIILAPTANEAERAAKKYHPKAAIKTEYKEINIEGSAVTLLRANKKSGTLAPCSVKIKPLEGDGGTVIVSDTGLDTISAIMALKGQKPYDKSFWESVEFLELSGSDQIHRLPVSIQEKIGAFYAFERSMQTKESSLKTTGETDVTASVKRKEEAVRIILDEKHPEHEAYIAAGRKWIAEARNAAGIKIGKAAEGVLTARSSAPNTRRKISGSVSSRIDEAKSASSANTTEKQKKTRRKRNRNKAEIS